MGKNIILIKIMIKFFKENKIAFKSLYDECNL